MNLKSYTSEELENRLDELEAWAALTQETWGNCNYDEIHRKQRDALGDLDPDDVYSDIWAINDELVNRAKVSS